MVRLCHVSTWQPMQCTLQSEEVFKGVHLVLEIPRTRSSFCWHGLIEKSWLRHWITHSEENLDFLQSCFQTIGTSQWVLSCHFVWEFVWSGFCMGTIEGHPSKFCEQTNEKEPALGSVSGVTFLDSTQQNLWLRQHSLGILQSTFYHFLIYFLFWWSLSIFLCPWTSLPCELPRAYGKKYWNKIFCNILPGQSSIISSPDRG